MKTLKIVAGLIALLMILALAGVGYIAATFDADAQRARLAELVKDETGRQLRIDGEFRLAFFPRLGLSISRATLSDRPAAPGRAAAGSEPGTFLRIDSAHASLRIMPLLVGKFATDRVVLRGLTGDFVRYRDGSTNFGDLLGEATAGEGSARSTGEDAAGTSAAAAAAIPDIDIAGIEISGANISWRDERRNSALKITDLSLQTGRVAPGVPGNLTVRATIEAREPALAAHFELLTGYLLDNTTRSLQLTGFTAQVHGDALGFNGLDTNLSALTASFDAAAHRLELKSARLIARDKVGLTANLIAPHLVVASGSVSGSPATLELQVERASRKLATQVSLSAPQMQAQRVSFEALGGKIELREGERSLSGEIAGPLSADLQARTINLGTIAGKFRISGPELPAGGVALEIKGEAGLDWGKELGDAQLNARIEQSNLKARLRTRGLSPLALDLEMNVDRLDVDRYFAAFTAGRSDKPSAADSAAGKGIGGIAGLEASVKLQAGSLRARGITLSALELGMRASAGKLVVEPLRAGLYGGKLQGSARADAATGAMSANAVLTGIDVGPLLHDLGQSDRLSGRGNARFALSSRGGSSDEIRRELGGNASIALRDGAVKGFNLAQMIRRAQAATGLKAGAEQSTSTGEQTDFSTLDASVVITKGVARNDDLNLKSPLLRVGGEGKIDIGAGSVDYLLKTTIVGTLAGQGGKELEGLRGVTIPVRVKGPFDKLSYRPDLSGAVSGAARQRLRDAIDKKLGIGNGSQKDSGQQSNPKGPADLIKGLLGR